MSEKQKTWSPKDVAEVMGCNRKTVLAWVRQGRMPYPIRVGRVLRWKSEVIERWLASCCVAK